VGNYRDRALGLFHGFLWDSGVFLTIDFPFPSATDNGAEGINNAGQIVGTYVDDDIDIGFLNGHPHGYLYANGAFSTVDFPGAIASWLADINDNGTVVGTYATDDPTFGGNFVFDQGVFVAFALPFPNLIVTHVQGINNRGQLVGQYMEHAPSNPPGEQFFRRGFIATQQP
jgi:uncharacterized membrane protein